MQSHIPPAVRRLKSRWPRLKFLEQAEAISKLVKGGISRRALARELGCSEGLLRHIQKAASLPASVKDDISSDRTSFRAAVMSTRKPLKPTTEAMPTRQNIDRLPTGTSAGRMTQAPADAKDWAKLIVDFAGRKYSYNKPDCRQIIKEARAVARHIPDLMRLNIRPLPPNAPMEYVIENSRPIRRLDDFEDISRWLAGWLLTLIPDKDIREDALEIAISELSQ